MQTLTVGPVEPKRVIAAPYNGKRTDSGTIVNNSETITVYLSDTQDVDTGSVPLAPQASYHADGSEAVYASTVGNGSAQLLKLPSGANWDNPVGVQIALNQLGLAKDTSVNAPNYGPVSLTNPGQLAKDVSVSGISGQAWSSSGLVKESGGILSTGIALPSGAAKDISVGALHAAGSTIAAEVANTGVGLLAFSQNVANPGAITMTSGQVTSYGPSSFSQISYEIGVTLQGQAGDGSPWLAVSLEWSDGATGLIIRREIWQLGAPSASANQYSLTGPAKGTRLKVTLHWYGGLSTAANGVQIVVNQTSRVYTRDDGRTIEGFSTYVGFTAANYDLDAGLIINTNPTIGATTTIQRSIPLYHGAVLVQVNNPTQNCEVSIQAVASADINTITAGTEPPWAQTVNSGGFLNSMAFLPRSACLLQITNNAASSGSFNVNIFIAEQEL